MYDFFLYILETLKRNTITIHDNMYDKLNVTFGESKNIRKNFLLNINNFISYTLFLFVNH